MKRQLKYVAIYGKINYSFVMVKNKSTIFVYKKSNLIGSSGGVEKVLSFFCNNLAQKGYNVYLATRDRHQGQLFFPVDKTVHFQHFKMKFPRWRRIVGQMMLNIIPYFNRELYVAKMIRAYCDKIRPDVIITAGIQDLADIVYHRPYPCAKIVQLHSAISTFFTRKKKKLFMKTLKQADLVQVLLPSYESDLRKYYDGKIISIGNAVFPNPVRAKRRKVIIYPARIEPNKAQHLLIESFGKVARNHPDWQIHFYGGVSRAEYFQMCRQKIKDLHLENQVFFKGVSKEMPELLASSSICAFPSRYEGFSLALTEAMAAGLPCVGFDYATCVNELIHSDQNGYLVHDADEMSKALDRLMNDEKLRLRLGKNALQTAQKYTPESIMARWEKVIQNLSS